MKLLTLLLLLITLVSYGQISEPFDNFDGPDDWTSPGGNTGSHNGELCFNISGNYLAGEFYVFQSPIYDLSGYSEVELLWSQESDIRTGDIFALYYYDNGWFYFDISNLNGVYTVSLPNTTIALAFVLNTTSGSGNINGKYSHVSFISIDDPTPLPVEMLGFDATLQEEGVLLEWSTASEYNSDYFSIYRSVDASSWTKLADIPSAGFSTSLQEYKYKDNSILYNHTYYRLKQTDIDGYKESWYPVHVFRKKNADGRTYNLMGQEVNQFYKGLIIDEDGRIKYND